MFITVRYPLAATPSFRAISAAGAGISKIFDIEHNQFVTASCTNCGFTEIYNPEVLEGKRHLGSIFDILFGG